MIKINLLIYTIEVICEELLVKEKSRYYFVVNIYHILKLL